MAGLLRLHMSLQNEAQGDEQVRLGSSRGWGSYCAYVLRRLPPLVHMLLPWTHTRRCSSITGTGCTVDPQSCARCARS